MAADVQTVAAAAVQPVTADFDVRNSWSFLPVLPKALTEDMSYLLALLPLLVVYSQQADLPVFVCFVHF